MRGSISKRGDSYRIKVSLGKDSSTGKYNSYYETIHGNKKAADKRLNEIINQFEKGTFIKPGKITVQEYLTLWLKDSCYPNMTPRTYEAYEYNSIKYIIPTIGNIKLSELKPHHLQRLYSKIQAEGHYRTAQHVHRTLYKALGSAVKTCILVRNPATLVKTPKVARHEMKPMTESDLQIFLEYAKNTDYYTLFYLALFTGMRRSELLALQWSDCDLLLCQLSVNRTIHHLTHGIYKGQTILKQPKTLKSNRSIALTPSTITVLKEHREKQNLIRLSLDLPATTDNDYIFCQWNGKPLHPDTVSHYWRKIVKKAGLKGFRFHDSRHTHATIMLKQGIHPKIVQERLGHSSIQITLDIYSHVSPSMQQSAANKFDDVILSKKPREIKSN